jgi:hypothetical protein
MLFNFKAAALYFEFFSGNKYIFDWITETITIWESCGQECSNAFYKVHPKTFETARTEIFPLCIMVLTNRENNYFKSTS